MPRTCHFMRPKRSMAGTGVATNRPSVAVSHERTTSEDTSIYTLEGGLRVTVERTWQLDVPCELSLEASHRFKEMQNPHNQCGPVLADQVPVVTGSDYDSMMAAFNKRCNFTAFDDLDDESFDEALSVISAMVIDFQPWEDNEIDRRRWEAKFGAEKLMRMREATHKFSEATYKEMGAKELSVKLEVLLKRNDPGFAPRIIYAGNDVFNAVTGPAMMVAMERLDAVMESQCLGPVRYTTAYKRTDTQLAACLSDCNTPYRHTVEGDYSANDRNQREGVHRLFNAFLRKIRMPDWLLTIFREINAFVVTARHFGIKAKLAHQLPTGTTATTVRNSLYNALMFSVACSRQGVRARALVLGDDLLARTDRPMCLDTWVADVASFKMVLKAKRPEMDGQATFLSRRFIMDRDVPCTLPLIGKAIARFNARAIYDNNRTPSQYMAGKSLSYAYEFRHVPFMRDFFLERYVSEDNSRMSLDELSWNTKSAGIDLENIVKSIKSETVLVSDDEFRDWLMNVYDMGLCDLEEICSAVILSSELDAIEHHAVHNLSIDW